MEKEKTRNKSAKSFLLTVLALIISNAAVIFIAKIDKWDIITITLIYWIQNVIIMFLFIIKILTLKGFSTKGLKIFGKHVEPTSGTRYKAALKFFLYYGIFHLAFLYLIFNDDTISRIQFVKSNLFTAVFVIAIVIFLFNHLFSFIYYFKKDQEKEVELGKLLFSGEARVAPMNLIVFGFILVIKSGDLVFFMLLKTIADVIMHIVEHKV